MKAMRNTFISVPAKHIRNCFLHRAGALCFVFGVMLCGFLPALPRLLASAGTVAYRIAFASTQSGNYEIYTVNPDGSGAVQLTNDSASERWPCYRGDGGQIAFATNRDGGGNQLYVMNPDGSNQT